MKILMGIISLFLMHGSVFAEPGEQEVQQFRIPEEMEGSVSRLRFHPDQPIVAASTNLGGIVIYDYEEKRIISNWTTQSPDYFVDTLEFLPQGDRILTSTYEYDKGVGAFEVRNWRTAELMYIKPLKQGHRQLEVSPDGRWVALVDFTHVEIITTMTGESVGAVQVHDGPPNYHWYGEVIFSNDGDNFFISNSERRIGYQFTLRSGTVDLIREIPYPSPTIYGDFSPDSRYLVTTSRNYYEDGQPIPLFIRNVNTGKEVWKWNSGTTLLYNLQMSLDNKFVMGQTSGKDQYIRVWRLEDQPEPTLVLEKSFPKIDRVIFGKNPNEIIVLGTQDYFFEMHDISTGKVINKLPRGNSKGWGEINLSRNMFVQSEWHKRYVRVFKF